MVPVVDFADEPQLAALRDSAVERFGAVHHVMAPMGAWWQKGPSLKQPAAGLRDLLATSVEAQFLLLKAMAPALSQAGGSDTLVSA